MMKLKIKIRKEDLSFLQRGKNFENTFNGVLIKASKGLGKKIVSEMKATMDSNGYEPNTPEYQAWKSLYGYDSRPLFKTNMLYKSIASEVKINLPNTVGGEVGWHPGARYPGNLQNRIWARGVPKRRRKAMGEPDRSIGPKNNTDTNYLAEVALWNNNGMGERVKHTETPYRAQNGWNYRKGKDGGRVRSTQRFRTRTFVKTITTRSGRKARPFVTDTREKVRELVFESYFNATGNALSRVYYMSKYWQGRLRNPDEVPF